MKKTISIILTFILCLGLFSGCGNNNEYRQQDLDSLQSYGIPKELLMPNVKPTINETTIAFDSKESFDKVKEYYQTYIQTNKAVEEYNYDTDTLTMMGMYQADLATAGNQAWLYQGTIGEKPISIYLTEYPINITSYVSVVVLYGEKMLSLPEGMQGISDSITIDGDSLSSSSQIEMITPETEYKPESTSDQSVPSDTQTQSTETSASTASESTPEISPAA